MMNGTCHQLDKTRKKSHSRKNCAAHEPPFGTTYYYASNEFMKKWLAWVVFLLKPQEPKRKKFGNF